MMRTGNGPAGLRLVTLGRLAIEPAESLTAGGPRPRRLALVAIIAAEGARGLHRERALAVLWPETPEERGRHALSQTLYALRHDLGREVVRGGPVLHLDPLQLSTDLDDFQAAIDAQDWARAAALYAGPFLEGFSLGDAPGFEEWLSEERGRIARLGLNAMESAAREAELVGDFRASLLWRQRLVAAEPLSSRHARGFVEAMLGLGDRAGALEHARQHIALIRRELDTDPDPGFLALVSELRAPVVVPPPRQSAPVPAPQPAAAAVPGRRWNLARSAWLGVATLAAAVGVWTLLPGPVHPRPLALAVGQIRDRATADSVKLGGVLSDMLATNLARIAGLDVIAPTRLIQAMSPEALSSARAWRDAARQAGAAEVVEGEVSSAPGGVRLELRRMDLRKDGLRQAYVLLAKDRFALIDSATTALTRDLALRAPVSSVSEVTTSSPIAYRLYEEGLRAFYQVDAAAAARLFRAALEEDSTFALAALYLWRATGYPKDSVEKRALRLAFRAPARERLLALTQMATGRNDLSALALADTLLTRYPTDPEALIVANLARQHHQGFSPAIAAGFEQAFAIDSAAGIAMMKGDRAGDALLSLADLFVLADSNAAAERTLRRLSARQPESARAQYSLSQLFERLGRVREADEAYIRNDALATVPHNLVATGLWKGVNRGDPDLIRQSCRFGLANARDEDMYGLYRWLCMLGYRSLGQLRDALTLTAPHRMGGPVTRSGSVLVPEEVLNRRILDLAMGRPRLAAESWLEAARAGRPDRDWPGDYARNQAWLLTLAATCLVAAGDTTAARALVDSIQSLGARSLYGRDSRLHHFVRGALLAAANRHETALEEFREALAYSWTMGYTRINLEYARSALSLKRPRDAIRAMQAALHGGVEGPQLYVTRTELHEMLARAFDEAGLTDSARTHYQFVARMWVDADPELRPRHRAAVEWLARHDGA